MENGGGERAFVCILGNVTKGCDLGTEKDPGLLVSVHEIRCGHGNPILVVRFRKYKYKCFYIKFHFIYAGFDNLLGF